MNKSQVRRMKSKVASLVRDKKAELAGVTDWFGYDELGGRFVREDESVSFVTGDFFSHVRDVVIDNQTGECDCLFDKWTDDTWGESQGDYMKKENTKHYSHSEELIKREEDLPKNVDHWDVWSL